MSTCSVENCSRPTRSARAELCAMHYHRQYRHGSTSATSRGIKFSTRTYRTVTAKGHPTADANGRAYEHRKTLYDAIGPGIHECHWCGRPVAWDLDKIDPAALQVDHINGDGSDNRPENLVASCRRCNQTRAMQSRSERLRAAGWWSEHDTIAALKVGRRPSIG